MKKDIEELKVEDIAIAIVPREDHTGADEVDEEMWDTYLFNFKEEPISSVLVNSRGYGELDGQTVSTSVLRHFYDYVGPLDYVKVEPILKKVFGLTNEYWVSFSYNNHLYDKKYIFVIGSIDAANFTTIPFLNRKGVMIK
jgi:hypothetical protein